LIFFIGTTRQIIGFIKEEKDYCDDKSEFKSHQIGVENILDLRTDITNLHRCTVVNSYDLLHDGFDLFQKNKVRKSGYINKKIFGPLLSGL
jgi:hypothetical protein